MLVFIRKRGESIMIGDNVEVVVDIRGDEARLDIEAHQDVSVHRREVYDAIRRRRRCQQQLDRPSSTFKSPRV